MKGPAAGIKQADIARFFAAKPSTPAQGKAPLRAVNAGNVLPGPAAGSSDNAEAAPDVAGMKQRKRLKRTIEDSPVKPAPAQAMAALEDELGDAELVLPTTTAHDTEECTAMPAGAATAAVDAIAPAATQLKPAQLASPPRGGTVASAAAPHVASSPAALAGASHQGASDGLTPGVSTALGQSSPKQAAASKATLSKSASVKVLGKASGTLMSAGGAAKGVKGIKAKGVNAGQPAAGVASTSVSNVPDEDDQAEEDAISGSSDSEGLPDEDEDQPGGKPAGRKLKARDDTGSKKGAKKAASKKGNNASSNVEGVGTGALEAAQLACDVDIPALMAAAKVTPGQPAPYAFLADTFEEIAETSKRLIILSSLTTCFRVLLAATPEDLLPAVYMCVNRVAPAHMGIELGVGESILIKALAESTGKRADAVQKDYEATGDLGKVAVNARATQRTMFAIKALTIRGVFQAFKDIAACAGSSSQDKKRGMIVKLLAASKGNEAGYVIRSLQAKLRIGLAEQSVLAALAHAVVLHKQGLGKGKKDGGVELADRLERASQRVKTAYSECPSYDKLVPALLEHDLDELPQHCHFMPSVPIKPMLAKATTCVSEVLEKFADCEFTCEYKYDGERAQIHIMDGGKRIMVFSRNCENMTSKYPDIVARLPALLAPGVNSLVLDGEAVGWDPVAKKILPFQILSTRARKDASIGNIKVQVVVFAFDCLYVNGKSLLQAPLTERRAALYASIQEKPNELQYAVAKTSRDIDELQLFLTEAVEASTEGLIVKTMDDTYEPSKRSLHWLKLKKDYMEGVGDTLDVVPIGAWYGKGKRTGVFGAYLLAVYDPDNETYQTISKLGTGFSEQQLEELAQSLQPHVIPAPRKYYKWGETLVPDVWFEPAKVWEVKTADLSISPVHQAAQGLVDSVKGISIRFPRLLRIRDDKSPEDATTAQQVADMYRSQAVVASGRAKVVDDDEMQM